MWSEIKQMTVDVMLFLPSKAKILLNLSAGHGLLKMQSYNHESVLSDALMYGDHVVTISAGIFSDQTVKSNCLFWQFSTLFICNKSV